jgi:ornithine cyclodeaminase/alanine dehydrogenase
MALVLSRSDVLHLLEMRDVIDVVERAHAEHASGRTIQPPRVSLALPDTSTVILPMLAFLPTMSSAGLKLLANFPSNRERRIPVQNSVIVVLNTDTGRCTAVLEGGVITAYRTAAASAVATRHLARQDSSVLALVGAGRLARTHLEAIRIVRPISRVLVWSRSRETAETFAREVGDGDLPVAVVDSPEAAVRAADVLCTLTPAREPVVRGAWFQDGLHVNAVGSPPLIDHREIDSDAVVRSRVVVDSREAVALESGDLMIPLGAGEITAEHFADEIGEVVCGLKRGRTSDDQITLYKSVGVAIQDIATAALVVRRSLELGVGTEIDL